MGIAHLRVVAERQGENSSIKRTGSDWRSQQAFKEETSRRECWAQNSTRTIKHNCRKGADHLKTCNTRVSKVSPESGQGEKKKAGAQGQPHLRDSKGGRGTIIENQGGKGSGAKGWK